MTSRIQLSLLLLLLGLASTPLFAQHCGDGRYVSRLFEPQAETDVVYGNAPELPVVYLSENITFDNDLAMDIYTPIGDTLQTRPCVILAYGGAYLFGSKEDEDIRSSCDSLARKGYVAVSIDYRMGLNVLDANSTYRAMYRGAQDYSAAVRYIKEYASDLGVDTNYIFIGGVSAGGINALHMNYLDEDERHESTYGGGLFGTWPDLGCLDCEGNNFAHSHQVRGILNLWGAMLSDDLMDAQEAVPQVSFHGTDDIIVPYVSGVPFGASLLAPSVDGSFTIHENLDALGVANELNTFENTGHNIWGLNVLNVLVPGPTQHWQPITDSIGSWLFEQIQPEAPMITGALSVMVNSTITYSIADVPQDGMGHWHIAAGEIVSAAADSSTIEVLWPVPGNFPMTFYTTNHLGANSPCVNAVVEVSTTVGITDIQPDAKAESYRLIDLQGRIVAEGLMSEFSLREQPSGLYIKVLYSKDLQELGHSKVVR